MIARADAARLPLPDRSVDLVIGSPPYLDARTYGIGAQRNLADWIEWMLVVTREAVRVSRGLVLWVCSGVTRDWCYQPGPEGLLYRWVSEGHGIAWRPCYWHRYGIPGSGGRQWYRADVEYVLAFTRERGDVPYGEPTANGHPPKFGPGGEMSYRVTDGDRRNQLGRHVNCKTSQRRADGTWQAAARPSHRLQRGNEKGSPEVVPALANPGNLVATGATGGGNIGHNLAHENEAPYPVAVPSWFVNSHCPPGGLVLDPFSGSGTTAHAAMELGRRFVALDVRHSQCVLTRRRLRTVTPSLLFGEPDPCHA